MSEYHAVAPFAAVIVAAGRGLRSGQSVPKQFAVWSGKPLLRHSVEALARAGASPLVVAIPGGYEAMAEEALAGIESVMLVTGGATRQASVRAALEALDQHEPQYVLIHDAARPKLSLSVIARLLSALEHQPGATPVLPVVDSLARADGELMVGSVPREELRRVQTPQAFHYKAILAAHLVWNNEPDAGDDAQVALAAGLPVALVEGEEALRKLTFAEDFVDDDLPIRVGTGFDVHRLAEGEELWLCGVRISHSHGLAGHSDADVALHAVTDALLGAVGGGDIGQHFPPGDPKWSGADSGQFIAHAVGLVEEAGYRVGNLDITIICEAPKIGPHRETMCTRLAELAGVDRKCVSVKATTTEQLGFTGRREGIAVQAVATVLRRAR